MDQFDVPIFGAIKSDISVIARGAKFRSSDNRLDFGPVNQSEGAKAELSILVRGEHRNDIKFTVSKIEPGQSLAATIGEPKLLESVTMYPLTIEVLPGGPLVNRMGPDRTRLGQIIIDTSLPDAKQVLLLIRYAVEQ